MTYAKDAQVLRRSAARLVQRAGLSNGGLLEQPEFLKVFMHASAYRFGFAMEMTIGAIGEALTEGDSGIGLDHYVDACVLRMICADEVSPFMAQHWQPIETTVAMDRVLAQRKEDKGKKARAG